MIASRLGGLDEYDRREVTCKTTTGDSYLSTYYPGKKDIALWIDVEGAQDKVLAALENGI